MINLTNITILIIGGIIGVIIHKIFTHYNEKKLVKANEILESNKIQCEECDMDYFKEEWKITIQTQMHFNDLIIKFRSTILSVFIAGLGVIYGLSKKLNLETNDTKLLFGLALIFWICCFLLDYFYYQRLLLGAVEHAKKFDENDYFKSKGFFGLTKRISLEVNSMISKILIWLFYLLPIIGLLVLQYMKIEI
jgi:hypothetical protein